MQTIVLNTREEGEDKHVQPFWKAEETDIKKLITQLFNDSWISAKYRDRIT